MSKIPKYATMAELVSAAQAGTLPEGFSVTIDNDSIYAYAGGTPEEWAAYAADKTGEVAEPYQEDTLTGELDDLHPEGFLAALLDYLKIPNNPA